jgi:hypothetical protein
MKWEDLSKNALDAMRELGEFGPTITSKDRMVKGMLYDPEDGPVHAYFDSRDLRQMAAGMVEVADWLDKRAEEAKQ